MYNIDIKSIVTHSGYIILFFSAECNRWSILQLPSGTTKLNAHVLTERLSNRSLLPKKLRCLLDQWRADRRFSGKPCGSCRVICSLSHARLRGLSAFLSRSALFLSYHPVSLFLYILFTILFSI